jgi:putative membrane-bound dehydrogenase-like protein
MTKPPASRGDFALSSRQRSSHGRRHLARALSSLAVVIVTTWATPAAITAAEPQWIWSPAYEKEAAPAGECYFRKSFNLGNPEHGEVQIGGDDRYELYVNGRLVGSGKNWKVLDVYDITSDLVSGNNIIAVKAANDEPGSAGLVARVVVKQEGGTGVTYSSDGTWKTSLREFIGWQKVRFNDSQWLAAREFGKVGATLPWGNEVTVAGAQERFKLLPKFRVESVIDSKDAGSLVAMTFDEFGQIIAARENGPLILVRDQDRNGTLDTVSTFSDDIKGAQGVLSVSGKIFAIGSGPEGTALYRLTDGDRDGQADEIESLLKFGGEMGEHGPHALALGPDGLLYMVVGNFSKLEGNCEASSPYHHYYEGDLLQPRYEDASGHAVGIKAPGGSILRTDTSATAVERVAGGLQNPYDLVFNREGELFTADSDMEWDLGMTWYRPTRVNHVVPGAEFGWRSGWAKWPDYYYDSLPPMAEMGRGSPAGLEVYDHHSFPARYHNALFVCDWSRGRIIVVKSKPHGATYKASSEVFLEGQPLNVTDLAVGPDGWLYFCTGGRDTEGGIYRVVWDGEIPEKVKKSGEGIAAALNQPQLNSAWARQRVAMLKKQLGARWEPELVKVAEADDSGPANRLRALDLLQLFGPFPSISLLINVSKDRQPPLRAKAAFLMGIHSDDRTAARLNEMLSDSDPLVQRTVCEALARSGQAGPASKLINLLSSPDRHVAWAARRALQQLARSEWQPAVLRATSVRAFLGGAVALVSMYPDSEAIDPVLKRTSLLLKSYLNDQDFLDTIRLIEVTLAAGKLTGNNVPELRRQLAEEYPAQEVRMNRELIRVLSYLQDPAIAERVVEQLESDAPMMERLHTALCARFLTVGWTTPRKLVMLKFLEEARTLPGGHSYAGYIENVSRDFFANLTEPERQVVLAGGAKWPSSALSVLAGLPDTLSLETLTELQKLDRQLKRVDGEPARKLRLGITAVLGASRDPLAMAYLRETFDNEPDRRVPIAMALAQQPDGENWPRLVRSLGFVEGMAAQEILLKLAEVDRTPEDPEAYRQVIIRGLMLRENGGREASALLEKWTGQHPPEPTATWDVTMPTWQAWFAQTYPDLPEPELPKEPEQSHWTYQELLSYLTGPQHAAGNASRGSNVFEKAQCVKCHRFGQRGEVIGPDLTTVARRFQRKEILESILFPSQVISDQYATQSIVTTDGRTVTGMVSPVGDGSLIVLQANGEKLKLGKDEIEEAKRTKHSAMPDGLLNILTLEEVADLFAYLTKVSPGESGNPNLPKVRSAKAKNQPKQ